MPRHKAPLQPSPSNTGFHGAHKSRAEAASLCFSLAKPVQDNQFDILIECPLEQRADFGDSARIEPAALCLRSRSWEILKRLRDVRSTRVIAEQKPATSRAFSCKTPATFT